MRGTASAAPDLPNTGRATPLHPVRRGELQMPDLAGEDRALGPALGARDAAGQVLDQERAGQAVDADGPDHLGRAAGQVQPDEPAVRQLPRPPAGNVEPAAAKRLDARLEVGEERIE